MGLKEKTNYNSGILEFWIGDIHFQYLLLYPLIWNWFMDNNMSNMLRMNAWTEEPGAFKQGLYIVLGLIVFINCFYQILIFMYPKEFSDVLFHGKIFLVGWLCLIIKRIKELFQNKEKLKGIKRLLVSVETIYDIFVSAFLAFKVKYIVWYLVLWTILKYATLPLEEYLSKNPEKTDFLYNIGLSIVIGFVSINFIIYIIKTSKKKIKTKTGKKYIEQPINEELSGSFEYVGKNKLGGSSYRYIPSREYKKKTK